MIKVNVKKNQDMYYFLKVSGHANYDETGKDIVCASVSILAQTLIESIASVAKIKDFDYQIKNGYIKCNLINNTNKESIYISNILFEMFITGIKGILESYSEYLELEVKEVHSHDDKI